MPRFESFIHAPEINVPGVTWLNTPSPLSLADLKGKLVLLDFWTYCCINCIQILPTLHKVEQAFPNEVVVIGVHSPKFAAERDAENVRQAIQRYDIRHPVIHDPDFKLWKAYDVHAWPTMVFIDPNGYVIGKNSGEAEPLHLLNAVRDAVEQFDEQGTLQPRPLKLVETPRPATSLLYPGKIKPLPGTLKDDEKKWLVADSGHHQIVVLDDNGKELQRYGTGASGGEDGGTGKASFNSPQGLAANDKTIFVADTGNHAIRAIDRASGAVATLSGNGTRGQALINRFEKAAGRALASPWDLELKNNYMFFANAGTHQLGGIDLDQNVVRLVAGSGGEDLRDGNVLTAELAQPSGLIFDAASDRLYFADSETSSIRYLDMKDAAIHTLVGAGLFEFGHVNGALKEARLQHCLGLSLLDDRHIVVADSYNAALRLIDVAAKTISDLDENAWTCSDPLCLPLAEPAGVWADTPTRLLVSDTNNNRIIEIRRDTKTMKTWA